MKNRRNSDIHYIDSVTYSILMKQNQNPISLDRTKISPLTEEVIFQTDVIIKNVLFNMENDSSLYKYQKGSSKEEITYAKSKVNSFLKENNYSEKIEKCYDIVPFNNNDTISLLVVVKEGFLITVTETKEALLEHLLTLLRHFYDNDSNDWIVRREYLNLSLNKGTFDLVRLRLARD